MSGVSVSANPPIDRHDSAPSDEYHMPPFAGRGVDALPVGVRPHSARTRPATRGVALGLARR